MGTGTCPVYCWCTGSLGFETGGSVADGWSGGGEVGLGVGVGVVGPAGVMGDSSTFRSSHFWSKRKKYKAFCLNLQNDRLLTDFDNFWSSAKFWCGGFFSTLLTWIFNPAGSFDETIRKLQTTWFSKRSFELILKFSNRFIKRSRIFEHPSQQSRKSKQNFTKLRKLSKSIKKRSRTVVLKILAKSFVVFSFWSNLNLRRPKCWQCWDEERGDVIGLGANIWDIHRVCGMSHWAVPKGFRMCLVERGGNSRFPIWRVGG